MKHNFFIFILTLIFLQQANAAEIISKSFKGKNANSTSDSEVHMIWTVAANTKGVDKCSGYAEKSFEDNSLGELIIKKKLPGGMKVTQVSQYVEFNIWCYNNSIKFENITYLDLINNYETGFIIMAKEKFPKVIRSYEKHSGSELNFVIKN